jgi:hypothetical protein
MYVLGQNCINWAMPLAEETVPQTQGFGAAFYHIFTERVIKSCMKYVWASQRRDDQTSQCKMECDLPTHLLQHRRSTFPLRNYRYSSTFPFFKQTHPLREVQTYFVQKGTTYNEICNCTCHCQDRAVGQADKLLHSHRYV